MSKTALKILVPIFFVVLVYLGWQFYLIKGVVDAFGESIQAIGKILNTPLPEQEYYSPDSTYKVGVYRIMSIDSGSIDLSSLEVSLVDSGMSYPLIGNILSESSLIPKVEWLSNYSVVFTFDSVLTQKQALPDQINGISLSYKH